MRIGALRLSLHVGDVLVLLRLGQVPGMAEFGVQASDLCVHGVLFVNLEVADHQQKSMSLRQLWDCTMHIVGALRSLNMFLESLYAL